MMSNSIHFRPTFDVHGIKSCHNSINVNEVNLSPQCFQNSYLGNNGLSISPMFSPNNQQINCPISFSLNYGHQSIKNSNTFIPEAPIMPRDPEMLKNIDLLSSSVVKQGLTIEKMTQEKEVNNPKFGFLFESEPCTEGAVGKVYYEWKKNALQATFHPQCQSQKETLSLNHDCHESQAQLFPSNPFCSSEIQDAKKKTFDLLDQGSISSGGIDMEIEDECGGPITTYVEELQNIEKLENESKDIASNTLNFMSNHNKELASDKVEESLITKDVKELNEENNPHFVECNNINDLQQIIDENKVVENLRNNVLIDFPLQNSFEVENNKVKSFKNINVIDEDIGSNFIPKLKFRDAFEMDSIETMDFLNENDSLKIKNLKFKNSSSYVKEEEDHFCFNPKESSELVANNHEVSSTTNTIPQRSTNSMDNFKSNNFVSTSAIEKSYCSLGHKFSNKIVENQDIQSRTIHMDSQGGMDVNKILTHPIPNNVMTSKSIFFDEYGRTMKSGGNSSDYEDRHIIDLKENLRKDCFEVNEKTFINQNHEMQSADFNPFLLSKDEKKHSRSQRYGTKRILSTKKCVGDNKNAFQNYGHEYQNFKDNDIVKKRRLGMCKFYARGHCRRGHHCWFEHSKAKIDEKYDVEYNKDLNRDDEDCKDKSFQGIRREYCSGSVSSSTNPRKQNGRSEHNICLDKKIDCNEVQSKEIDDYNCKEPKSYLDNSKFVNKCNESYSSYYKMKKNERNENNVSLEKRIDCNEVQSKEFDDNNYLEDNAFGNESNENCSPHDRVKSDKDLDVSGGKNKQESLQVEVEENSDSCNGCSNIQEKNSKGLQKRENSFLEKEEISFLEKNIDNLKGLSNGGDSKKCKIYSKYDEISIETTKDTKDAKDLENKLQTKKSQLLDTTTSSDHTSAVSSTASLDPIPGVSSKISHSIQNSTELLFSQIPNTIAPSTKTSIMPKISQTSNFTIPIHTAMPLKVSQVSNQIRPMQPPMPPQPSQKSSLIMPYGKNQREILSNTQFGTGFGNIPNPSPSNAFVPKLTSRQTNMSHLQFGNPSVVYSPSIFHQTSNFSSSRNINIPPPIQYPNICPPIPQNLRSQQDNIMQSSHFLHPTSIPQRHDHSLLPSFSNSQSSLQTMKYPSSLLHSDYNSSLKNPLQPYSYVQSSMLNNLPQQNSYSFNSTPQITYSQIQNDLQPSFKGSSSNVMQFMNQRFPTLPNTFKYNSLLTPTTSTYSLRPTEASILQQNCLAPPPLPPPLEPILSTRYNNFDSYTPTQIYSSLPKPYIGSKPFTNQEYEFTNSQPTPITSMSLQGLQNSKHDTLKPYTLLETPTFENVSPIGKGGQSWIETKEEETIEGSTKRASKQELKKKCKPKVRGLTLLRKSIAGYTKELLKPKWREGIMTKEAFKIVIKKTVDKVTRTVKVDQVPNNEDKVETYLNSARPKILKLVQGYLTKYVKD